MLINRGFCHIAGSLTPYWGATGCDAGHPGPVMHTAGPRLHTGALKSIGLVTHLHYLKVLSKVWYWHPKGEKGRPVNVMLTYMLQKTCLSPKYWWFIVVTCIQMALETHQNSPSSRLTLCSLFCSWILTVFHSGLDRGDNYIKTTKLLLLLLKPLKDNVICICVWIFQGQSDKWMKYW